MSDLQNSMAEDRSRELLMEAMNAQNRFEAIVFRLQAAYHAVFRADGRDREQMEAVETLHAIGKEWHAANQAMIDAWKRWSEFMALPK